MNSLIDDCKSLESGDYNKTYAQFKRAYANHSQVGSVLSNTITDIFESLKEDNEEEHS
jgi:hypothetical protein